MTKNPDKPPGTGVSYDDVYENGTTLDITNFREGAMAILKEMKNLLIASSHQIPLTPIQVTAIELLKSLMEAIRGDEWVNQNCIIICFNNTSGNRHVALALARDAEFWRFSPQAKNHLNTQLIAAYNPHQYAGLVLQEIKKEIN